jgi:nitrite reductase/ring-hydroxylating ferredoxin subunit
MPPEHVEAVGIYYRRLYARLWDQDESMMSERQRQLDRAHARPTAIGRTERAPVPLGDELSLRRRLPLLIEVADRFYRIVEAGGDIVVHSAACPHMGGPLAGEPLDESGCVTCPWHGYRFDVRSGRSADGRKLKLAPAPRVEIDEASGEAMLRWNTAG